MLRRVILTGLSLLALGCAVVFDGRMPAWAQGGGGTGLPGLVGPAVDPPAMCWIIESNFEGSGRKPIWKRPRSPVVPIPEGELGADTVGPDIASKLFEGEPSWADDGKTEILTALDGTIRAVSVPCPPSTLTVVGQPPKVLYFIGSPPGRVDLRVGSSGRTWTGPTFGIGLLENFGHVRTTETFAPTGAVTNEFSDWGDPLGVGVVAGYNFAPWNNNVVVGPFASFDLLKQTINHTFPGGAFLGTTTHWIINVGAKGGVVVARGLYLYGLAGAAWLNQDLNINFATAASSNVTTPGFTLGLGGEYHPSSWSLLGNPLSLYVQYQRTWWSTANFNTPVSSPFFNYAFKRDDNTIKLGVNIHLSR
jgi:hypothetical protein